MNYGIIFEQNILPRVVFVTAVFSTYGKSSSSCQSRTKPPVWKHDNDEDDNVNTAATLDLIQHYPLNFPFSHSDKCSIYIYIITWRLTAFQLTIKRELLSFSLRFSFFSLSQRKQMAGADLRAQLNNYIKDMHDQVIISSNPDFCFV
jgi:hypothetical protein